MKYVLSDEERKIKPRQGEEVVLYRIRAIRNFTTYALKRKIRYEGEKRTVIYEIEEKQIKAGERGGFVQSEKNLSQEGSCWIDDDAFAFGLAKVCDNAYLGGKAAIGGKVRLFDNTQVIDDIQLGGSIKLHGHSKAIGKGSYHDDGTYKDVFLGKIEGQKSVKKITEQKGKNDSTSSGKIRIEIQIDDKKFVNNYEF